MALEGDLLARFHRIFTLIPALSEYLAVCHVNECLVKISNSIKTEYLRDLKLKFVLNC